MVESTNSYAGQDFHLLADAAMFVLSTLEDKVRLAPKDLGEPTTDAISKALESSYLDRVIPDLGLVVTLYDILDIGEGHVFQSDGGAHYTTKFRVVVFRPSIGEVLIGKVLSQDESMGIKVGLGFFEDLIVPPYGLSEPHSWVPYEQAWCWDLESEEGASQLFFETGQKIRVQVTSLTFSPPPTPLDQAAAEAEGRPVPGTAENPHVPMKIGAKADGDGLGMIHWYEEGPEEEMEA